MPRGKSHRRSQAMKRRVAEQLAVPVRSLLAREDVPTRMYLFQRLMSVFQGRGTGYRHRVGRWPISPFTGKSHKLVIPPESPDKKFVFVVGDSHLRHFADGFVALPEGCLSFAVSSTPGACASELEKEVVHTQLDRTPSLVVVLAPSNNLTASRTVTEAASDFGRYLATVCSRWQKVVVLDFPPRLTVEVELQTLLSQEYHRVAARMSVKYYSVAEHFPMDRLHLWARDGVHLSDTDGGMDILGQLIWTVSFLHLSEAPPATTPPTVSQKNPPVRRVVPKLVVTGPDPLPRPHPSEWTLVGQGKKGDTVSTIPLCPVRFSADILEEMDKVLPSDLDSVEFTASLPTGKKVSSSASKWWIFIYLFFM
uniref:Uncharacterized protein n=1 Tax=Amphilophus citrinellus TaxID=61819 RepID=A0A3Q0T7R1_AMPCI